MSMKKKLLDYLSYNNPYSYKLSYTKLLKGQILKINCIWNTVFTALSNRIFIWKNAYKLVIKKKLNVNQYYCNTT